MGLITLSRLGWVVGGFAWYVLGWVSWRSSQPRTCCGAGDGFELLPFLPLLLPECWHVKHEPPTPGLNSSLPRNIYLSQHLLMTGYIALKCSFCGDLKSSIPKGFPLGMAGVLGTSQFCDTNGNNPKFSRRARQLLAWCVETCKPHAASSARTARCTAHGGSTQACCITSLRSWSCPSTGCLMK